MTVDRRDLLRGLGASALIGAAGCLGPATERSEGCGCDDVDPKPVPEGRTATAYRVCVEPCVVTQHPLELRIDATDSTVTPESPARLRFTLENRSTSPVEVSSGAPYPFTVLHAEGNGRRFTLWSDRYLENGDVTVGPGSIHVNAIGIIHTFDPGETKRETFEIHYGADDLAPGTYQIPFDVGYTSAFGDESMQPDLRLHVAATDTASSDDGPGPAKCEVSPATRPGWSEFQRDARNTGHHHVASAIEAGEELWRFATDGAVQAGPAAADGTVYVPSDDGHLYALDAASGEEEWRFDTRPAEGRGHLRSTPAVADGTVYVAGGTEVGRRGVSGPEQYFEGPQTYLFALDAATGDELWRYQLGGIAEASPTLAYDTVYVGANDGYLHAIDRATGERRWRFDAGEPINVSSPAIHDCTVYLGSDDEALYAVDAATGERRWHHTLDGATTAPPTATDDGVFAGSNGEGTLYKLSHEGDELWTAATGSSIVACSPAVDDERVYVGNYAGGHSAALERMFAFDRAAGDEIWRATTGGYVWASPAIAGDTVHVADLAGNLFALDAATGERRWTFRTDDLIRSSPAVHDGRVYVGSDDGNVYAVGATES